MEGLVLNDIRYGPSFYADILLCIGLILGCLAITYEMRKRIEL